MAESDLSSEVNATTILPAPTIGTPSYSNGEVTVPWTNNDDSPDGGIDVERSTDGFSTVTTVASGLSPSTESYTDTTVTEGMTYEYRIERNTDHATATSGTASVSTIQITATASAGVTATGTLGKAKATSATAAAGATATPALSGTGAITAAAAGGVTATGATTGWKAVLATADAGATAAGDPTAAKPVSATAAAGATVTRAILGTPILGTAAAGATGTATASGAKNAAATAAAGATVVGDIESLIPLRRVTSATIDNDRTDEFDVQATGETE